MSPLRLLTLALPFVLAHLVAACAATRPPQPVPVGERARASGASPAARAQADMTPTESAVAESSVADPTVTDPDKYHLVLENQRVRVLRYHDVPGTKTHQHRHPDSVLHALSAFRRASISRTGPRVIVTFSPVMSCGFPLRPTLARTSEPRTRRSCWLRSRLRRIPVGTPDRSASPSGTDPRLGRTRFGCDRRVG